MLWAGAEEPFSVAAAKHLRPFTAMPLRLDITEETPAKPAGLFDGAVFPALGLGVFWQHFLRGQWDQSRESLLVS